MINRTRPRSGPLNSCLTPSVSVAAAAGLGATNAERKTAVVAMTIQRRERERVVSTRIKPSSFVRDDAIRWARLGRLMFRGLHQSKHRAGIGGLINADRGIHHSNELGCLQPSTP